MIKALFLDIDGTLVSFQTHTIPASTIEALRKAHEKGVQIFIATGRPPVLLNNLGELQKRGLIDGYMTMNGSYCVVGDEVIYQKPIAASEVKVLAEFCQKHQYPCIFVDQKDGWVCQPNEALRYVFYEFLQTKEFPITPMEEAISHEIFQITSFFSIEVEKEIAPYLPGCEFGRWHPIFTDVTSKGNTKQLGIDQFIRHFGFKLEETMSFGDGGNDIPMLRHAGIGVAMGNASEEVKAAADYVTTSVDEDGIARALEHFGVI